ncbi:MAG: DnaJ domain-containing protein [Dehalococcoidales bacterium]|nr:DnaJ domain-containing protein [Dehalococcoidales bacterium]
MEAHFARIFRYYQLLGVDKNVTQSEIKKAYRTLAKKFHPDVNKDPSAIGILKKINEAYSVLSNPITRKAYDTSEAECPKCFTHEVSKVPSTVTSPQWNCKHCGCKFNFYKHEEQGKVKETLEPTSIICPRCKNPLLYDNYLTLYRCSNGKCKGVFSHADLVRSKSIKIVKKNERTPDKFVLPRGFRLVLKITIGFSITLACSLLFLFFLSESLLIFGLLLIVVSFALFSWWIYKYPRIIEYIKSLILRE